MCYEPPEPVAKTDVAAVLGRAVATPAMRIISRASIAIMIWVCDCL